MEIQGIWQGRLFHPNLKDYITGESFQIEILSNRGVLFALVTEEVQIGRSISDETKQKVVYAAAGELDSESNFLCLFYETKDSSGGKRLIELHGEIDMAKRTMSGSYEFVSVKDFKGVKVRLSFHLAYLG